MDVAALVLAVVAAVLFFTRRADFGLAALTVVFICQWVHLTGHLVTVN